MKPWLPSLTIFWLITAANAAEISSFQAGDGGWHMGTLAVGNLDGDPQLEIVVPYRNSSGQWFLDAFKWNGTRLPGFPFAGDAEINTSPTLYDLDGDGRDEIIFTCGNRVIALHGDGSLVWSNAVTRLNYIPDSGYMTVTNGFYWSNGGAFISNLPATAVFSSQVSSPMVADINGSGTKEVVTAWKIDPDSTSNDQDFNPFINDIWGFGEWGTVGESWSGGVVFLNATNGAKDYVYHFHQLVESGLALGHADTNRPLEVYVLNDSDSVVCFDKTKPHGLFGNGNLHKQFGKSQQLTSGSYQVGVDVNTADIDGDGLAEALVPTTSLNPLLPANETILDDDGAILWRKWNTPVTFPVDQWQNNACMIPVNPDHDNHIDVLSFTQSYEIAYRYWNGVELVDHAGWPKSFYPFLPTPPVMGDVDGDGQEEIIIGTYNPSTPFADGTLYVFAQNGTLKTSVPVPGGLKHIPTLANVTGQGLDVVYRSLAGKVYIQNFGATNTTAVSWSTHRGNKQRDGNYGVSLFPAGTPMITSKTGGYRRTSFSWNVPATNNAKAWRVYRADRPDGTFTHIATLTSNATSFTDDSLQPGRQYLYEVAADYGTNQVYSAPFAILSLYNNNLIANAGFEENDNSHWDKWFSGDIESTNMVAATNVAYQGDKSMQIRMVNKGSGGSISQCNQYGTPDAYLPVTPGKLYSFGGFFKSGGLSQPSEHWLEWTSTKTGENTNDRPVRPYPLYFTPHFVVGTGPTDWEYANRTFVMPAGFPNVEVGHRYTISAPGSGSLYMDNLFFRELPAPGSTNWTALIPFGASWRYNVTVPPLNWFNLGFDDSLWLSGKARFGTGGGPTNIATPLVPQQPAYFFRRTFTAPSQPCEELLLSATCTRGVSNSLEIYLNGTKLPATDIDPVSDQGNDILYYDLTPFSGLLQPGANTIAVTLHNTYQAGWDDVAFDISLKAVTRTLTQAHFSSLQADTLHMIAPSNSIWRVESTDSLSPASWQLVDIVTNNTADLSLRDNGQRGRLLPAQTRSRFYRLVPE